MVIQVPEPRVTANKSKTMLDGGGAVGTFTSRKAVLAGYILLGVALFTLMISALDNGPDAEDYESSEEYTEAVEDYQSRSQMYPSCMLMFFLVGLTVISGGLVNSGMENSTAHPYIRIAAIVCGTLILTGFVAGFFDVISSAFSLF